MDYHHDGGGGSSFDRDIDDDDHNYEDDSEPDCDRDVIDNETNNDNDGYHHPANDVDDCGISMDVTEQVWDHILLLQHPRPPPLLEIFDFLRDTIERHRTNIAVNYMARFEFVPRSMLMLVVENTQLEPRYRYYIYEQLIKNLGCSPYCRTPIGRATVKWTSDDECILHEDFEATKDLVQFLVPSDPNNDQSPLRLEYITYTALDIAFFMERPEDVRSISRHGCVNLFATRWDPAFEIGQVYPPTVMVAMFNGHLDQLIKLFPNPQHVPPEFRRGIVYAGETALTYLVQYIIENVTIHQWQESIANPPPDSFARECNLVGRTFAHSVCRTSLTFADFYPMMQLLIVTWQVDYCAVNRRGDNALGLTRTNRQSDTVPPKTLLFVRALLTECIVQRGELGVDKVSRDVGIAT